MGESAQRERFCAVFKHLSKHMWEHFQQKQAMKNRQKKSGLSHDDSWINSKIYFENVHTSFVNNL
jgi:hypothetical protein